MCMTVEHMKFIDSISFLPVPLLKLAGAFGLSASKSWYQLYLYIKENLHYVGPVPDVSYYGLNDMSDAERTEFLEWSEGQKSKVSSACNKVLRKQFLKPDTI